MTEPYVLILMGVAGVGKSTVGRLVADRLGWAFFDADDLHPAANVAKMRRGEALTDADRAPWLDALRSLVERRLADQAPAVLACSALTARYRDHLHATDLRVQVVWLDAPPAVVARRLGTRRGHYAGLELLESQLATLEAPAQPEAVRIEAEGSPAETARRVVSVLSREGTD